MNNSGEFTHKPRAVPPEQFRAAATGIGQSFRQSLATGMSRAQRVSDNIPPACRAAVPEAEGFPPATPVMQLDAATNTLVEIPATPRPNQGY